MSDVSIKIVLKNVSKHFGKVRALDAVDIEFAPGTLTTLLGPSGCGKTTLLHILGGCVEPSSGRVQIDGRDVTCLPPAKRPTTSMFQDYALFPHMNLRDNVGFGLRMAGVDRHARSARAGEMLAELYKDLSPWRKCQVARHPDRPHSSDYVEALFSEVAACSDEASANDWLAEET